jgi:archaellin
MDIIAVNATGIYIYTYDQNARNYTIVYSVTPGGNAFTILADVDADGFNELIVTTGGGTVRCYDTPAPTPNPPPRTNIQFYSEYHCGAAEYVPPPGPKAPQISELSPLDGATNVPISLSQLTFKLTDYQHDPINYTVTTNPDIGSASGINVHNVKVTVSVSGLAYSTTYTWTVTATDGTYTNTKTFTFTTSELPPWYDNWQYRRTIIIDHTKVSGDKTNFPVLIDITDSSFAAKAQPDGDDFVFTDQDNNKLDHQLEYYDNTIGHLIAWVKAPYLSSTVDTMFYLYYGNPNCGSQQNPAAVWDESCRLVLHLNEKSGTHFDSTANNNDGAPRNGVAQGVSCKLDGGDAFDGANDYIEIAHSDTIAGFTEALTVSFWIKLEDTGRRQTILGKYNAATNQRGWFVDYNPIGRPKAPIGFYASPDGSTYKEWYASFTPSTGIWYQITIVWQTNKAPIFYINGARASTIGTATISQIHNNAGVPLYIGRCQYDNTRYFKGSIDEIQIISTARTADWIITAYNNQQNPITFHGIGSEETSQ